MKEANEIMESLVVNYWCLLFLAGSFAFGFFTSKVAHEKGYSAGWWFLGGFFFAFVALLAAVGLPDRQSVRSFHVGQRVYARSVEGTVIRIDADQVFVDDGHGNVSQCKTEEVFPRA
jgi:hypothetical protein